MSKTNFESDALLLQAMQGSDVERSTALDYFFKNPKLMPWVLRHVQFNGGTEQDGQDVFEESFIVFERQVRTGHFRGESSLVTFFHGIARWQWHSLRRKDKGHTTLDEVAAQQDLSASPEILLISKERRVILSKLIAQIGERCQKLLSFYQLSYKMNEISQEMNFSSAQVAANEVHQCRKKLKKIIESNAAYTAILKNRDY